MRIAALLLFIGCLSACGSEDDSSEPAAGDRKTASQATGQEREAIEDPARREALRERLEALQRSRSDDADQRQRSTSQDENPSRSGRSRATAGEQRSGGGRVARRWWENETIVEELGLSSRQSTEIAQAYAEAVAAARKSRRSLAQVAAGFETALTGNDPGRLDELLEQRVAALEARARAEAAWTRRLSEILEQEQLRQLVREHPGLVGAVLSPLN